MSIRGISSNKNAIFGLTFFDKEFNQNEKRRMEENKENGKPYFGELIGFIFLKILIL